MANPSKRYWIVPVVRIYDDGARRDKAGEPVSHLRRPKPAVLSGSAVPFKSLLPLSIDFLVRSLDRYRCYRIGPLRSCGWKGAWAEGGGGL